MTRDRRIGILQIQACYAAREFDSVAGFEKMRAGC